MPKRLTLLILAGLALPSAVGAQLATTDDIVDRVMAVVGDSVILWTEVNEQLLQLASAAGEDLPEPGPELDQMAAGVLEQMIDLSLVIQEAAQDTLIRVDEGQIDERVAAQIDNVTQQFGGGPALQQALAEDGLNLASYRDFLRIQIRQDQIRQMFLQRQLQDMTPAEISEDDLLEAFQAARGELGQRPKLISFSQGVMKPEPSEAADETARAEADSLLVEITGGADFAELAMSHSDDTGSAVLGGDLGWFKRGAMVDEFDDAAFGLRDGEVSELVQTQFGYHIIKIERRRGGERSGRHILIMPEISAAAIQLTRDTAASVVVQAVAGESMLDLYDAYSDPEAPDSVTVPFDQIAGLPGGYTSIATAVDGQVLGPIEYQTQGGETRIAILKIIAVREAGAFTFEDVRAQLANQLQEQGQYARILEELRAKTHIEIRE